MNLLLLTYILSTTVLELCSSQDYASPTYNPDVSQTNPTNDYLNPDPKYDNPYDPNRRYQNRNQNFPNQQYDPNRPYDPNRSQYDPNRGQYDPSRPQYDQDQRYNQFENRNPDVNYNLNQYTPDNTPRPSWDTSRTYSTSFKGAPLEHDSVIINEATYFIVASKMVRPGQIYKISANILQARMQMTIRASISCNGVEIADVNQRVKEGVPEILNMRVPPTTVPGDYKLRVEGLYLDTPFGGRAFVNESQLMFSRRFMTIFIQMDKPVYMQGQTVRFRVIPINTELKAFGRAIDVYILDPNGRIMKRWLSRQSNFGTVSLQYQMSDQPLFGEWSIRVEALGQIEETTFLVEEYYQTRYEVNVTMPAFFFNTEPFIHGRIMANYTSGAPVRGNLTLKATIRPIPQYRPRYYTQGQFNNRGQFGVPAGYGGNQYTRVRQNPYNNNYNSGYNNGYNDSNYQQQQYDTNYGQSYIDEYGRVVNKEPRYIPGQPNQLEQPDWWYDPQKVVTRMFNFDEKYPFWMPKPDPTQYAIDHSNNNNPNYNTYTTTTTYNNYYNNPYYDQLPYLRFFNGTYDFKYPMSELAQLVPTLDGVEVIITASVGDPFLDEVIEGYSIARIFNSSLQVTFLGGTPQVFKPSMPFDVYMVVSYHDGSPLPSWQARGVSLQVHVVVEGRGGAVEPQQPTLVPGHDAVWHLKLDLYKLLRLQSDPNYREVLNSVTGVRLSAQLVDAVGSHAAADVHFVAHYSANNQHIRIATSTTDARVGEYIIFHVQSNFYMESFNYVVMSKGIILTSGQEIMQEGVRTFAVTVSAEMAPVATVLVWSAQRRGHVLADSLTFPVNGISRNNFTVFINNRKHRTGERVEVAIYGEPGAYVGLSAIDNTFYTMQAGNELTYAKVISKMSHFDESTNGTFQYTWRSHFGDADDLVYFPSSTFGIDANRTFEYAGLLVFSDVAVTRRYSTCNVSQGYGECLEGGCYPLSKRCDGAYDCPDHTDEANCENDFHKSFELTHFRKFRFNRVQRQYDNVWLWRDVNIGPHGRYVFTVDVPQIPAHWIVSAFSMSPSLGLGMLTEPKQYVGVLPFFIKVEGPEQCRQGEQVGLRVVVFNYQPQDIEAVVVLAASPDYKFVHVEENGIVRSYNPRTSFGEHQFFVYISAGDAATVHVPVVATRLGDIHVRLHAATLMGQHHYVKKINVQPDGLPQYRHQSVLLDLSNRAYVFQYMHVNVTETPIIPYEVDRYYVFGSNKARISIVGDVVGPLFPTMPVNASSLLHLPMDSAEQNMFSFAANMYLTLYMRLINQRNRTLERDAFYHMNILYQRQLSFMKPDGSFSLFRSDWNQSASSVWLTSFCAKIFQDASFNEWENFIYIDPEVISTAVSWVLDHQTPEGAFYEVTWLPNRNDNATIVVPKNSSLYREAFSNTGWHDPSAIEVNDSIIMQRNITLTAQVVITLETVKNLKDIGVREGLSARVSSAQQRGVRWLERHLRLLHEHGDPYSLALVAHALTYSKAPSSEHAYRLLKRRQRYEGGLSYWGKEPVPQPPYKMENQKPFLLPRLPYKYDSNNIAATAYALLACMDHQDNNEPIVMWLNSQRLQDGGWASTQDTYIALRALIEYTNRKRLRDVSSLTVSVDAVALSGETRTLHVKNDNLAVMQFIDIPEAWGTVKVTARGAGYAILQMSVQYNVDIARFQTPPPVNCFSLVSSHHFYGRNQSHIEFQGCASWTLTQESPRSGMAVLEVGVPTGYMIQQQKLDAYVLARKVPTLQRAKYLTTKILFYFDYLSEEPTCVNFTIERWFPVANMSRYLPMRVYDYYAPERFNESIFDALPTYLLNICEVCGSSQCPYCAIYNNARHLTLATPLLLIAVILTVARYIRPQVSLFGIS
ncbi:CD109 antigen [Spodoptera frugiperda]|uniref:CD109 antigen n=1 Tax=Spodoptera frugiperda TaxID=7108 RepID=A0A9R0EV50_SPOFR|nr:CD109 antigen [Spodoptera frugiperda]XP_050551159.1 CD109 antigen [Spodoptera frugiperda]XP_050551160.1 CD109 antigen [Spodoptera frugiperda]